MIIGTVRKFKNCYFKSFIIKLINLNKNYLFLDFKLV